MQIRNLGRTAFEKQSGRSVNFGLCRRRRCGPPEGAGDELATVDFGLRPVRYTENRAVRARRLGLIWSRVTTSRDKTEADPLFPLIVSRCDA